jgi:bifunctional non-homologous end joining protein LigD
MLATPAALPADGTRWAAEIKWDGYRAITSVGADGALSSWSRNRLDVAGRFPVVRELTGLGRDVLLDGEILAFDDDGNPSFGRLQRLAVEPAPLAYLVFDLLSLDGHSLLDATYEERRGLLSALGEAAGFSERLPSVHVASSGDDPEALLAASRERGLEGVVCKLRTSRYEPGRRSPSWVKVKNVRTQDVFVIGWRPGEGNRAGRIGALLVGVRTEQGGPVRYAGRVGTGFSGAALADLAARLAPLELPEPEVFQPIPREDARDATWVQPVLMGEVAFTEWTPDGRLRHPAWRGLRDDIDPLGVVRDG